MFPQWITLVLRDMFSCFSNNNKL